MFDWSYRLGFNRLQTPFASSQYHSVLDIFENSQSNGLLKASGDTRESALYGMSRGALYRWNCHNRFIVPCRYEESTTSIMPRM
jgi:hypothetical protein